MKQSIKIWLLAIVYQTVILAFLFQGGIAILIFTLIELIGGIPGLFIFNAIINSIRDSNCTLFQKWLKAIWGAIFAACATSGITLLFFMLLLGGGGSKAYMYIVISGIVAPLSLFTFYIPVNKFLKQKLIQLLNPNELTELQKN